MQGSSRLIEVKEYEKSSIQNEKINETAEVASNNDVEIDTCLLASSLPVYRHLQCRLDIAQQVGLLLILLLGAVHNSEVATRLRLGSHGKYIVTMTTQFR